jgi:hypothetical protein
MATRAAGAGTEHGAAMRGTDSGEDLQSLSSMSDRCLARERYPRLYYQITGEHDVASFDHVAKARWISYKADNPAKDDEKRASHHTAKARWIRHNADNPAKDGEKRASRFLENEARRKFSEKHGGIEREYWNYEPFAGCALTCDGRVHCVMNSNDPELVLYEAAVDQLSRDAYRTFEQADGQSKKADGDLKEVGEMLYVILARVIVAAAVLEKKQSTQRERDDALAALRAQWKTTRASVTDMIQRQARFEYFEGVGLSAFITIPVLAAAGWASVHYGLNQFSEPGEPGSFTAAIIGGAAGAVISVTQRMTSNTSIVLDSTAPKWQKKALGALRPVVGAVFGAVVYFALIGGLLAVHARTGKDASVALGFFAVAGFAAGFSERFATDVLQRASSGILPTTRGGQDAYRPDELSLLLSEQSRHVEPATATIEPGAATPQGTADKKGGS